MSLSIMLSVCPPWTMSGAHKRFNLPDSAIAYYLPSDPGVTAVHAWSK